jgi:hypothetical protein
MSGHGSLGARRLAGLLGPIQWKAVGKTIMRIAGRLLFSSFVITFTAGPVQNALAAEAIMLRAGEATRVWTTVAGSRRYYEPSSAGHPDQ